MDLGEVGISIFISRQSDIVLMVSMLIMKTPTVRSTWTHVYNTFIL